MRVYHLSHAHTRTGNLVLVNPSHPLQRGPLSSELTPVVPGGQGPLLERRAARLLRQLLELVSQRGEIVPVSGFRTQGEQEKLWADSLRDNGEEFTRSYVALPGCSEHQTGLAIDLGENRPDLDFIRPSFPSSGVCGEFLALASQYGFVRRYPAGKEAVTKIASEPWHFRFVGWPHSRLMEENGWTLEEYTEKLEGYPLSGPHLHCRMGGQALEVFTVPVPPESQVALELPEEGPCVLSGNNRGGVVVTLWRGCHG